MIDAPDAALLEQFVRNESEEAFAEIVRRHIGLVHSVARRQTQNSQHAEEITQAVFIILARKASSLGRKTILSGWLYHTARLTAANFQRSEIRRVHREQEVFMQSPVHDEKTDSAWRELGPLLEEAMSKLGTTDRDAIVLRFFENKTLREVGSAMGMEERAAQKRVARGLEKLRAFFSKRGVVLTTAVIAGAVAANSVQAAPRAFIATVTFGAKTATPTVSTLALVKGTMKTLFWTNIKIAALAGAGIFLLAGAAVGVNELTKSRVYETEMVESYRSFPLTWSQDKKTVSGPFLRENRPASRNGWDAGFRIGPAMLGWSLGTVISLDGKAFDWIYLSNPLPPDGALWEIALSSKSDLDSVTEKDLECDYYGLNDPRGPEVFGENWKSNALRVATNQIFFARVITNRSTTYIVSLAKREIFTDAQGSRGAALARYIAVQTPQHVAANPPADVAANPQPKVAVDPTPLTSPANVVPTADSNAWQQAFDAVYKLNDGEVLRYIPRPFIPERQTYYQTEMSRSYQANPTSTGPDRFIFKQNKIGQFSPIGAGFGLPLSRLRRLLFSGTFGVFRRFKNFEFDGDLDLFSIDLPGDWTIREGTSREAFLAALEPIIYKATGRQILFEKQTVERDVLVAHGKMNKWDDDESDDEPEPIKIYAETPTRVGTDNGDLQDLLGALGDDLGMYMVNEAQVGDQENRFEWKNYIDADFHWMGERRADLSKKVLENFSRQTGLTFTSERRKIEIWVISEKK